MTYTTMWAYTWDLTHEDADAAVCTLKEHVGLDAVSVATSYHTFEMLCPHRKGRKFLWATESAVYFHPQLSRYEDTPIKPHVSPMARESDPLRTIGEACERYSLGLTSWTVCLHNSYLAGKHPDHAQVNAFGDVMPHALCASSPAVQQYMIALATDLTANYPVTALELESLNFMGYGQGHYHGKYGLKMGPVESFLFSLCFCDHCLARAHDRNLDAEALRVWTAQTLDRFCETDTPVEEPLDRYVEAQSGLSDYVRLRAETVTAFTLDLVNAVSVPVYYLLMGEYYTGGMDYNAVASVVDRVEILTYTASPDRVKTQIEHTCAHGIEPGRLHAGFQAYAPASPDRETLLCTTRAAVEQGVGGFSFYNYGIMPRKNLDWVKAAVEVIRTA